MNAPAAIKGCFSDFKIIRGRKVCQLVVEVPIEEADAALAAMGGVPSPAAERWVAVARLNLEVAPLEAEAPDPNTNPPKHREPPRPFNSLPLSQQAALKCADKSFQVFMKASSADDAAIRVRKECRVKSRAEIEYDPEATQRWFSILTDFDRWQRGYR